MSYHTCRVLPKTASPTDYDYGIILIGMRGVGKSSIINSMINTTLDRNLENLLITNPSQKYSKISSEFILNHQDFASPKIYEISGPLTDYKKIRILEIQVCKFSSMDESFSDYLAYVSKYLTFVSLIGIVEISSTNRITPEKKRFYSSIKEIFSAKFLGSSLCFFLTHYAKCSMFETSIIEILPQLEIGINNNIYSYSRYEYRENGKLRKKQGKNLTKIKLKFEEFFRSLVKQKKMS